MEVVAWDEVVAGDDNQEGLGTFDYDAQSQGIMETYIGHKWIHFTLSEWSCDSRFIDVEVKLSTKHGLVGIWIPSSDRAIQLSSPAFEYLLDTTEAHVYIDRLEWQYGDVGKIRIHNEQPSKHFNIKFSALLRPIFEELKDEVKVYLSIFDELRESVVERIFPLKLGRERDQYQRRVNITKELNFFREYNALTFKGRGNIVHPKQHLTIRGFKYILDNFLDDKSKLTIGYIGTDTTENLRSLIRWLIHTQYISQISEFRIFYTTEWDYDTLQQSGFEEELKKLQSKFTFKLYELSTHTVNQLKNISPCHVIVSTFVTPWVEGYSRDQYQTLLENSMNKDSYLLSVDPKTGKNSVRAELNRTNINNDILYKEIMKLNVAKSFTNENKSVEVMIWNKSTVEDSA